MATEELCTVEVMLNGHTHKVVVAGHNSPAFGFDATDTKVSEPALLRFRCDICKAVAKLSFTPPSHSWRRPFVVRRVDHLPHE